MRNYQVYVPRPAHVTWSRKLDPADVSTWVDVVACDPLHRLLYRFRAADGALLYVGSTWNPKERWKIHRKTKPWWPEVSAVDLECHVSDQLVHEAEYTAITSEAPRHNKHGVRS